MTLMTTAANVERELIRFTERAITTLSINLNQTLYDVTPELTGFAETNWLLSVGDSVDTPVGVRGFGTTTRAPQVQAIARLNSSYRFPAIVYLSNPVAYIVDLNMGSSAKAPAGFVETAIAQAIRTTI